MKGSLKNNMSPYYQLLLLTATPALIGITGIASLAAPIQTAQVAATANINRPTLKIGSQGERVSELQAALKLLGFYTGTVDGIYSENTASAVSQFKQAAGLTPDGVVDSSTWQKLFPSPPPIGTTATVRSTTPTNTTPSATTRPRNTTGVAVPSQSNRTTTRTNTTQPQPNRQRPTLTPRSQNTTRTQPANTLIQPTPKNRQNPNIQYTDEGWPILRVGMRGPDVQKLQQILQRWGFLKAGVDGDFGVTTETAVKAAQTRYGLEADGVVGGATWEAFLRQYSQQR